MACKSVAIVGGGLGGLALAHLLRNSDIKVTVYERDPDPVVRGQGYRIGLNNDGVSVLRQMSSMVPGLDEMLSDNNNLAHFLLTDASLKELASFGGRGGECRLNRWGLREKLTQNLDVQWGKKFTHFTEKDDGSGVVLYFEDGTTTEADILVGADGAQSRVRKQLCPTLVNENLNITSLAGTVPAIDGVYPTIQKVTSQAYLRILGNDGHSLLVFQFVDQQTKAPTIVWSISWPSEPEDVALIDSLNEPGQQHDDALSKIHKTLIKKAGTKFSHPEVVALLQHPLHELIAARQMLSANPSLPDPFKNKTSKRAVLLGDAAHPMTTHRGLGANTAFVDASKLAEALQKADLQAALSEYDADLYKRGFHAVRESLKSTRMMHATGWNATIRNLVLTGIGWGVWAYTSITGTRRHLM